MRCRICCFSIRPHHRRAGDFHLDCLADAGEDQAARGYGVIGEDQWQLVKAMTPAELVAYVDRLRSEGRALLAEADALAAMMELGAIHRHGGEAAP